MKEQNTGDKTFRAADRLRRIAPGEDPATLLREAFGHFQAGRLADTQGLCARLLEQDPRHFEAHQLMAMARFHAGEKAAALARFQTCVDLRPEDAQARYFLGNALAGENRLAEAAEQYRGALEIDPDYAEALTNLGGVLQMLGRLDDAIPCYEKSLALNPASVNAMSNLAIALQARGRFDDAIGHCRRAIELDDSAAFLHFNLGVALEGIQDWRNAERSYRRALEIDPNFAEAYANLGILRQESGAPADAIGLYDKAIAANPDDARLYCKLALALRDEGRYDDAEKVLRDAIRHDRTLPETFIELGLTQFERGDLDGAAETLFAPVRDLRAPGRQTAPRLDTFDIVTRPKLEHDGDQLAYLLERNVLAADDESLIGEYRDLAERLPEKGLHRLSDLTPQVSPRLAAAYNRAIHVAPAGTLAGGALNPDLDRAGIEADFASHDPGFAYFDDFLRPEARDSLWQFCLESTIWFDVHYVGDVGAGLENGFACPLVLQIAQEVRNAFPSVFGGLTFTSCWAYKYLKGVSGLGIHTDEGSASINFWITPDAANNDPESGGLMFWNKQAPYHIYGRPTETKREIARRAINEPDAVSAYVPYRCNRAMIFRSNVFHDTAPIDFKDGYENKRINMTFVYGRPRIA
jgi:tetratricopeptide (TPR) repeat protein